MRCARVADAPLSFFIMPTKGYVYGDPPPHPHTRVYDHTTTAMHKLSTPPTPPTFHQRLKRIQGEGGEQIVQKKKRLIL